MPLPVTPALRTGSICVGAWVRLALPWLVLTLAGCSEAPKPDPSDTQALAETAQSDSWLWDTDADGAGQSDVVLPDLGQLDSELACPGAAGCSCAADSDCVLGLCVETAAGRVCASLCSSECPPGFLCRSAPLGGDPVSYCAPAGVRQCAPCNTQADCNSQWSVPAVCVAAGAAGSFCAQTCNLQSDCPGGLACVAVPGQGKVCQPQAGLAACTCSAWASAQGASTACFVVEGTKACPGVRSCGAAGLLACTKLDGEACADATCTGAANGQPCDDGDPCTQSECQAGVCTVTDNNLCQCQSTADCPDDANLCNGKPFCDKSSPPWQCKTNPASVVNCPQPTDPCKLAVCDPATGSCSTANAPDNTPCSDGAACTVGDVCVAGSCIPGTVTCACNSDADCAGYEDGNQCNGTLFCNKVTGQCQVNPKTVVYCPTGLDSACQQTVCVPKTGACELALAPTTTLCDDGNPCSASDHCMDGSCVSTTNICVCQSDADCASSDDGNLCNGTLYCELSSGTCQINPKTVVLCPITASNPCAPIVCQPSTGECQPSPLLAGSCDDGDPCTAPGSCVQGACVAGPQICQCKSQADCAVFDDANPCNGTFFCDTAVGQCKTNLAAVPVCPPSGDGCQVNACDPQTGGCTLQPAKNGTQCQDGEACTKNDTCQLGQCQPGVSVCVCLSDADCAGYDDGDPCNGWWFCDKSDGPPQCVLNPLPKVGCGDVGDGVDSGGEVSDVAGAADGGVVDAVGVDAQELSDVQPDEVDAVGAADQVTDSSNADAEEAGPTDSEGDLALAEDASETTDAGALVCGDGVCDPAEVGVCVFDCGCVGTEGGVACDDGNACTTSDVCVDGQCLGSAVSCLDDYFQPVCNPLYGCLGFEVCNGMDDDGNGTTDDVTCGVAPCACLPNGSAECEAGCTECPNHDDVAIPIDDGGTKKVICAPDYHPWGMVPDAPDTLTALNADVVVDSRTGLEWQRSPGATQYTWDLAKKHCDSLVLDGKADWRVPTVAELETLVDFAKTSGTTIDLSVFPDTGPNWYWTWIPRVGSASAWYVTFYQADVNHGSVGNSYRLRCVRTAKGGTTVAGPSSIRWAINQATGTVVDQRTGLMWQRQPPLTGGSAGTTNGRFNWSDAKKYCQDLVLGGYSDWRLPTLQELRSLLDRKRSGPATFDSALPTPTSGTGSYWSATPFRGGNSAAWYVEFATGYTSSPDIDADNRVRCVRTAPCGDNLCEVGEETGCPQDCQLGCGGGGPCEDGNLCTVEDKCVGGECIAGSPKPCSDGNPCTLDSCNAKTGNCVYTPVQGDACMTDSVACPVGQCVQGQCAVDLAQPCEVEVDVDLCSNTMVAPGVCNTSGTCKLETLPPELVCPDCNGMCVKCFVQVCIPF